MSISTKVGIGLGILGARLLRRRIPLLVGWQLTAACNLRCQYCNIWARRTAELRTDEVLSVIDQLQSLGTKMVALSGGEPLIRKDIPHILEHCQERRIAVRVHTNGYFIRRIEHQLGMVHAIVLSLDGPESIHDAVRGTGAYRKTLEAAELARRGGTKVLFNATLTSTSVACVDEVIEITRRHHAKVTFQPVVKKNGEWMDVDHLKPTREQLDHAIARIQSHRSQRGSVVANSHASLLAFRADSRPRGMDSAPGRIYAHISYDGKLYASCSQMGEVAAPSLREMSVREALERLHLPVAAGPDSALEGEMDRLYYLDPEAILNAAISF